MNDEGIQAASEAAGPLGVLLYILITVVVGGQWWFIKYLLDQKKADDAAAREYMRDNIKTLADMNMLLRSVKEVLPPDVQGEFRTIERTINTRHDQAALNFQRLLDKKP